MRQELTDARNASYVQKKDMHETQADHKLLETHLEAAHKIAPETQVMLFGDQAYGSSIEFYLGRQVGLVNSRTSSMFFGSTFPDCPPVFLSGPQMLAGWGNGPRKIVFVPLEARAEFEALMGTHQIVVAETGGKALFTDRPLDTARPLEPAR